MSSPYMSGVGNGVRQNTLLKQTYSGLLIIPQNKKHFRDEDKNILNVHVPKEIQLIYFHFQSSRSSLLILRIKR